MNPRTVFSVGSPPEFFADIALRIAKNRGVKQKSCINRVELSILIRDFYSERHFEKAKEKAGHVIRFLLGEEILITGEKSDGKSMFWVDSDQLVKLRKKILDQTQTYTVSTLDQSERIARLRQSASDRKQSDREYPQKTQNQVTKVKPQILNISEVVPQPSQSGDAMTGIPCKWRLYLTPVEFVCWTIIQRQEYPPDSNMPEIRFSLGMNGNITDREVADYNISLEDLSVFLSRCEAAGLIQFSTRNMEFVTYKVLEDFAIFEPFEIPDRPIVSYKHDIEQIADWIVAAHRAGHFDEAGEFACNGDYLKPIRLWLRENFKTDSYELIRIIRDYTENKQINSRYIGIVNTDMDGRLLVAWPLFESVWFRKNHLAGKLTKNKTPAVVVGKTSEVVEEKLPEPVKVSGMALEVLSEEVALCEEQVESLKRCQEDLKAQLEAIDQEIDAAESLLCEASKRKEEMTGRIAALQRLQSLEQEAAAIRKQFNL